MKVVIKKGHKDFKRVEWDFISVLNSKINFSSIDIYYSPMLGNFKILSLGEDYSIRNSERLEQNLKTAVELDNADIANLLIAIRKMNIGDGIEMRIREYLPSGEYSKHEVNMIAKKGDFKVWFGDAK